jgi:hypothetical protein
MNNPLEVLSPNLETELSILEDGTLSTETLSAIRSFLQRLVSKRIREPSCLVSYAHDDPDSVYFEWDDPLMVLVWFRKDNKWNLQTSKCAIRTTDENELYEYLQMLGKNGK